jgi:hypothetical protein
MTGPATSSASEAKLGSAAWLGRIRLLVTLALLYAALHYILSTTLMPPGLNRPVSLAAAHWPVLAGLILAIVLAVGAYVCPLMAGPRYRHLGLAVVALGLACWAYPGGTMDDWLLISAKDGVVGPPTSAPYWPLVIEYVALAAMMALAAAVAGYAHTPPGQPSASPVVTSLRRTFGLDASRHERSRGILALAVTTIVTAFLTHLLSGPTVGKTFAGQVSFAVAVASALGVVIAARLVDVRRPIWFWPAPILAGLIGMLVAAFKPDLMIPAEYNQLNSIPAWGLARPLPIQMVGLGVAVTLWTLRATSGGARSERA